MSEKMQGSILRRKILWNNYLNFADRFLRRTRNTDTSLRSQRFMKRLKDTKATQEMLKSSVLSNDPFLLLRFGLYEYQLCYKVKRSEKRVFRVSPGAYPYGCWDYC